MQKFERAISELLLELLWTQSGHRRTCPPMPTLIGNQSTSKSICLSWDGCVWGGVVCVGGRGTWWRFIGNVLQCTERLTWVSSSSVLLPHSYGETSWHMTRPCFQGDHYSPVSEIFLLLPSPQLHLCTSNVLFLETMHNILGMCLHM